MAPLRWHRLSLMKQGLYDIAVSSGTIRELALLFHEQRERKLEYKKTAFQGAGPDLESPEETLDTIYDMLVPGSREDQSVREEQQARYLRSLAEVDWSEHFEMDPEILEDKKQQQKAAEKFGDIAAH